MKVEANQTIGRFRLIRPIGEGGFGDVWLAEDERRRPVAIKFLKRALSADDRVRFNREIEALGAIEHVNVIKLVDTGSLDGVPYIVTEFVEGETLRAWMRSSRSIDEIRRIAAQLASALAAAHRAGVTHRDLKPPNIIMTRQRGDDVVKVLDFGIAKFSGQPQTDITKTGDILGTPGFMSPEQLRGRRDIGPATDLYNLGVLLWEMIEGRPIFAGRTALDIGMQHLSQPPPPLTRSVPSELDQLVFQLLDKAPERRGSAAAALNVLDPRAPSVDRPAKARRRSMSIAALVVGCCVLAAALVWWTHRDDEPRTSPVVKTPDFRPPAEEPPPAPPPPVATPAPHVKRSAGCGKPSASGTLRVDDRQIVERAPFTRLPRDVSHSLIHVPQAYDSKRPSPLIVALHDGRQLPSEMMQEAKRLLELADREHVLVLFMEGDRINNLASAAGYARKDLADRNDLSSFPWANTNPWANATPPHVFHAEQLVSLLMDAFCIDPDRVFLLGQRRGSRGAEALLARSTTFARAVLIDHHRRTDESFLLTDSGAIPTLWITSRNSPKRPLDGRKSECLIKDGLVPFGQRLKEMREHHGCGTSSDTVQMDGADCETWSCKVPFISCLVDGGGRWPDHPGGGECEGPATTFDYGGEVWKFFDGESQHP